MLQAWKYGQCDRDVRNDRSRTGDEDLGSKMVAFENLDGKEDRIGNQ